MNRTKIILVLSIVFIVLVSCNTKEKDTPSTTNKEPTQLKKKESKGLQKGCYVYNDNRSTISLHVIKKEDSINGTLLFTLARKDKNTGRFIGHIKDSVLLADYTFESEGVESIREVAFRIKNDTLLQGYGSSEMKDGKRVFTNPSSLTFDTKFPLVKKPCVD